MAGLNLHVNWLDMTLAVGSYKTMATVKAPANQMVRIKGFWTSTNGVSGDAEHLDVRLCRITVDSGTASLTTPQKTNNALTAAPQSTCRNTFTAEPTESGTAPYLCPHKVHPQGSSTKDSTFDEFFIKEGTEIAFQVKVPSGGSSSLKCSGHLVIEE